MNYSKEAIAEAFLILLDEKPFNKITVKDIVEKCGVNRNTFYYHFQDIPTLLEQILISRIDTFVEEHAKIGSLEDCIYTLNEYFIKNKKSIMHVYHALDREFFIQHLDRLLVRLVSEYIDSISSDLDISSVDRSIIIRFFKCSLLGVFLDWLNKDMSYDLMNDSLRIYELQNDAAIKMIMNACNKGLD